MPAPEVVSYKVDNRPALGHVFVCPLQPPGPYIYASLRQELDDRHFHRKRDRRRVSNPTPGLPPHVIILYQSAVYREEFARSRTARRRPGVCKCGAFSAATH